jgi:hypothetical protein
MNRQAVDQASVDQLYRHEQASVDQLYRHTAAKNIIPANQQLKGIVSGDVAASHLLVPTLDCKASKRLC